MSLIAHFGGRKNLAIMSFLILLFSMSLMGAVESAQLVFYDNFNNYEAKTYSGRDGPGIWVQDSLAAATYSITGGVYKIQSSGGFLSSKAILDYYRVFSRSWPPSYEGPNDYIFTVQMKIDSGSGGIIFRAMPGSQEKYWLHYRVLIIKSTKKVTLARVYEDPTNPSEAVLKTVDFPSGVNIDDFFRLSVKVQGSRIEVYIANTKIIDVTDTLGPTGGVGLMTGAGSTTSFDWAELDVVTTTVTNTVTSTTTSTVTSTVTQPPTTITETITTAAPTVTITETATVSETLTTTVTGAASTVTEIVTETTTSVAPPQTTTITEISTAPGPTVTKTITETVTSAQVAPSRCLIATAAFGSEIAPQVQALREFRDGFVMKTFAGENFMNAFNVFYYSWSPYVAQAEYGNEALRAIIRTSIYPLLWILNLSKQSVEPLSTIPELAVLISGVIASSLIGLVYFSPIIVTIGLAIRRKGKKINLNPTYPLAALITGLILFALAEFMTLSSLMMVASSIIVLSSIAIVAIVPSKILLIRKII